MRQIAILASFLLLVGTSWADSIDDFEAKRRGLSADAYKVVKLQEQNDSLNAKIARLESTNAELMRALRGLPIDARLASASQVTAAANAISWGSLLKQIPATVIDKGVMRAVPYFSYRAGNYEVNIYGDPEKPAGVEVGIYQELLKDAKAKRDCLTFIRSIMRTPADRNVVDGLNTTKDLRVVDGLTFEITPETATDSYGGWWVSVYNETALAAARASDAELEAISVSKTPNKTPTTASGTPAPDSWTPAELTTARPTSSESSGGGSVFVRGYFRKDGTYVNSYTRRK